MSPSTMSGFGGVICLGQILFKSRKNVLYLFLLAGSGPRLTERLDGMAKEKERVLAEKWIETPRVQPRREHETQVEKNFS